MFKFTAWIISLILIISNFPLIVYSETKPDPPEDVEIEWDDDYSEGSSSQKVTMTVEVPSGAEKIKFYLFADDDKIVKTKSVDEDDDDVWYNFYSLDEAQEVWGYATAVDDDGDESDPSEWVYEYIDEVSNNEPDIEIPEEPEIEWEDAGEDDDNYQRVTISAQLPDDADRLRYYLICDGDIKESSKTDDEEYTFRNVDYDQKVIGYVKAYDGREESYRSETVTLYIGDDGEIDTPDLPGIQWIDRGYDSENGQTVKMNAIIPNGADKIRYYLIANGTVMTSPLTASSSYVFYNILDNQLVTGFVRAYDKFDNESDDSAKAQIFIPDRITNDNKYNYTTPSDNISTDRILIEKRGLSIRDFKLPEIVIDSSFTFSDIDENDYELKEAAEYFSKTGIFDASFNNKLKPNSYISRADFLKLLFKATKTDYSMYENIYIPFKDINYGDNNHNPVAYAVDNGIMNGTSSYRFYPNNTISIGDASRACVKHLKIRRYIYQGEGLIDDVKEHCISALEVSGIFSENQKTKANSYLERGEAFKIIYRLIKLKMSS